MQGSPISEKSPSHPYADPDRKLMHPFVPEGTQSLLDVGCHFGAFGAAMKRRGVETVWGVEPISDSAKIASDRLDHVINDYFHPEQLPDAFFDVVTFNDVLEHMVDPIAALRDLIPKLKPGGVVIASIPNLRNFDNLVHILRDKDFRYERNGVRDSTHLRFYTKKSIPRLFEASGYTVSRLTGIDENWWTTSLWRRLAFRLFPNYLEDTRFLQYAVVAQPVLPASRK